MGQGHGLPSGSAVLVSLLVVVKRHCDQNNTGRRVIGFALPGWKLSLRKLKAEIEGRDL